MRKLRNQKGFTLMELMVVIVIVAILAAVAVPLYINYVKDAQRTEAKGAIGAISTAQQFYYQKSGIAGPPTYAGTLDELKTNASLDLTEPEAKWTFVLSDANENGYKVTATYNPDPNLKVCYDFQRTTAGTFTDDCVTPPAP